MSAWEDVRRRLAAQLRELADEEFVVLGDPAPTREPGRGLLRRRPAPAATRFAQVRRSGDHLYAECVGATSFGGDWEMDDSSRSQLSGLGWLVPGEEDPSGVQPSYPNHWCVRPSQEADVVAAMCADALEILGSDPTSLEWRRDS